MKIYSMGLNNMAATSVENLLRKFNMSPLSNIESKELDEFERLVQDENPALRNRVGKGVSLGELWKRMIGESAAPGYLPKGDLRHFGSTARHKRYPAEDKE